VEREARSLLAAARLEAESASARLQWALEIEAGAEARKAEAVAYYAEAAWVVSILQERGLLQSAAPVAPTQPPWRVAEAAPVPQSPAPVAPTQPPWRVAEAAPIPGTVVQETSPKADEDPDYDPFTVLPCSA